MEIDNAKLNGSIAIANNFELAGFMELPFRIRGIR
jgi:hypothetical protein